MNKLKYILSLILFWPLTVFAQSLPATPVKGFLDSIECIKTGVCGLDNIAEGFIYLTQTLLGLMGAFALFYFVWGGIWWLTSAGNPDKVKRGRDVMVGTTIALFIAFGSYLLLNLWINNIIQPDSRYEVKQIQKGN